MTYSESYPRTINQRELARELTRHGLETAEFYADYPQYLDADCRIPSATVLAWLGY